MARTVQVRADDTATKIRKLVEGTRLTYDGFEKPGSRKSVKTIADAQRRLYADERVVEMVERVMDFYTEHPIPDDVLASHDSQWYKQNMIRVTDTPVSTGAVIVGLQLLGYTLRGNRHELTEHAAFYAPGKAPAEAVEATEVSWGTGKDAAVKKANQRRKKREHDAAVRELEDADKARRAAGAAYNEKYRKVHGTNPPKVKELEDASSRMWLSRTHWDMVDAGLFGNRDGLAHLDAYLCAHAKSSVPASEKAREDWQAKVPSPQEAAAALGKDPRNVRKLYIDLVDMGRMRLKDSRYEKAYLVTWRDRAEMSQKLKLPDGDTFQRVPDIAPESEFEDEYAPVAIEA